mgnify:CR=1 FL=1
MQDKQDSKDQQPKSRDDVALLMLQHFLEQWRKERPDIPPRAVAVGQSARDVCHRLVSGSDLTVAWCPDLWNMSHHASASPIYQLVVCLDEFQRLNFDDARRAGLGLRARVVPGGLLVVGVPGMRKTSPQDVDYYDFAKLEDAVGVTLNPVFEAPRGCLLGWWRE